ncbi:hypothetical protein CTAYLR_002776 [Chrysophaeum taylorii]|uniref:Uncharacterized protein n=1 Tax=Chrysophaeum taylorii TaxID=2483200 RepID=A0AAD7XKV4_9STRA|nr:hypothetical protein CTAYLR_002776 [Chrysophaeum taylorii]
MLLLVVVVGASAYRMAPPTRRTVVASVYGDWQPVNGGSYVLEPPAPSKKVVHFIGGAFVGAASQLTYRYLLEKIADRGFVVIATPYRLSFDYVSVCDAIDASFHSAMSSLDEEAEEIIGIGHSCGALLHALLSLRDEKRSRLAFISFNNKGVQDAVPLFDELVVPLATEAMRDDDGSPAPLLRQALGAAREVARGALDLAESRDTPLARLADQTPLTGLADLARREVVPAARQSLQLADQLPDLLREVADGARDFDPTPRAVRAMLRSDFKASDSLVIQFENDDIDESDDLYAVLRDVSQAAAKAAPPTENDETPLPSVVNEDDEDDDDRDVFSEAATTEIEAEAPPPPPEEEAAVSPPPPPPRVELKTLAGTHLTPLTQDIFLPASTVARLAQADFADPILSVPRDQWLGEVDALFDDLDAWLGSPSTSS